MNELEVINFQSHIYSYLEFHKGVNIIRGTSNYGKSSLVRSIRWTIENQPSGAKYRNWDKDAKEGFESHLSYDEGTVSRIHKTGFNGYLITQYDSGEYSEEEFEALRGDVPKEVFIISGMDASNLWGQDDGYFLIKDSPGNVSRKLNERAGLEDIDKVAKIAKGMIDDYKNKVKFADEGLERALDREEFLLKIARHKETIEDIDGLFKQRDTSWADMRDLQGRVKTIHEIQTAIDKRKKALEAGEAIKEISNLLERRLKVSAKSTKLRLTLENLNLITDSIYDLESYLKAVPTTHDLQFLIMERTEAIDTWNKITETMVRIKRIEQEIKTQAGLIESYQSHINELSEFLDGIKSCSVCGALKEHWRLK